MLINEPEHVSEGAGQTWDPDGYAANARFVAELGAPVLALLSPRAGERILDLGCGDGVLTAQIAARGAEVVGVDSSEPLVLAARARGLSVRLEDGHALSFSNEFDAVFSNAALHWMKDPDRVIDGVFRALRSGGRFVGELGGTGCIQTIATALEESLRARGVDGRALWPWYFPSAPEYRARLEARGFVVRDALTFPRPTPLPTGIRGWLDTFGGVFLAAVPAAERDAVIREVETRVTPVLAGSDGIVLADYVRLRFFAEKPRE
jgi:SAM-dependent methyltransferase